MNEEEAFWEEVERRKVGVLGIMLATFFSLLFLLVALERYLPDENRWDPVAVAFILLSVVGFFASRRVTNLRCPRCEDKAFASTRFRLKGAKCQHCGLTRPDH